MHKTFTIQLNPITISHTIASQLSNNSLLLYFFSAIQISLIYARELLQISPSCIVFCRISSDIYELNSIDLH